MPLSVEQEDALKEVINVGFGRAADTLNQMTNSHIALSVPSLRTMTISQVKNEMSRMEINRSIAMDLRFFGPFVGTARMIFPSESATNLVRILTGEEPVEGDIGSVRIGTLTEVSNVVLNGVMGSIGNILKIEMSYDIPTYVEDLSNSVHWDLNSLVVLADTSLSIQELQITGDILLIFGFESFNILIEALDDLMRRSWR